jgi:hypothetical protein
MVMFISLKLLFIFKDAPGLAIQLSMFLDFTPQRSEVMTHIRSDKLTY